MDASAAFAAGTSLGKEGRHLEALPFFERVVALAPDVPQGRINLASALGNAAFEVRVHLGKAEPVMRSSYDRILATHESLVELDRAEQQVSSIHDRTFVRTERGRALESWGFPIDALAQYRQAESADPTGFRATPQREQLEVLLRNGRGPGE